MCAKGHRESTGVHIVCVKRKSASDKEIEQERKRERESERVRAHKRTGNSVCILGLHFRFFRALGMCILGLPSIYRVCILGIYSVCVCSVSTGYICILGGDRVYTPYRSIYRVYTRSPEYILETEYTHHIYSEYIPSIYSVSRKWRLSIHTHVCACVCVCVGACMCGERSTCVCVCVLVCVFVFMRVRMIIC